MSLKLLQLNIFKGKFLSEIVDYVKLHDFDIVNFQEVSGGALSNGGQYKYPAHMQKGTGIANPESVGADLFKEFKNRLQMDGEFVDTYKQTDDPNSYFGNATYFKSSVKLLKTETVMLHPFTEFEAGFCDWQYVGRAALITEFEKDGEKFLNINGHFAWGPNPDDEDYKIEQAEKLYAYLKTVTLPFVLTGDFNVHAQTKTARMFEDFGKNLTAEHTILNTLNFNIHPAKQLYPPGLAVDFIFTTPEIHVTNFKLIDTPDLSDHYGLSLEFTIE